MVAGVRPMKGYHLRRSGDGYELTEPVEGGSPKRIATIERRLKARTAELDGWRFRPVTMMNGPVSKVWATVADALVGFGIATAARARQAVAVADANRPPPPL